MTDRPILFSGPMVRALLDGRKTQTRRVIDFPGIDKVIDFVRVAFDKKTGAPVYEMKDATGQFLTRPAGRSLVDYHYSPRFAVGDRLYVREAWQTAAAYDDLSPASMGGEEPVRYDADGSHQTWGFPAISKVGRFRQGMHMPRWASRLTLTVTDVRVQRLQAISPEDAIREGYPFDAPPAESRETYIFWYRDLWDSLNDKPERPGCAWRDNPWVVAVTFTVERRNIDEVRS